MSDPQRLSSKTGSPEALLLSGAQVADPPPSAEEQVWRRLQAATAVAAAGGTTALAAHQAAAGANVAAKGLGLAVLKWGAVVAIAGPVVGLALHRVLTRHPPAASPVAPVAAPSSPNVSADAVEVPEGAERDAPKASGPSAAHPSHVPSAGMSASALRAETRLLESARAKLAAGNADGALEDVAKLGVQFPHGRLLPEREVLAIDSLEASGDRAAARARALAFLAQFPSSPYAARLRQRLQP
jgi:hypothetical protein